VKPLASRVALLLCPLLACLAPGSPAPVQSAPASDVLRRESIAFEDGTAEFVVRTAHAEGPRPLILALHYGGPPTRWHGGGLIRKLVGPAFRELDAVIVAPTCPGGGWTRPRCEAIALRVLDHALASYPVDRARVLVTGFSMGGMGTWHFATRHAQRFSAAVPVAGRPLEHELPGIPVWALHSSDDEIVPIAPSQAAASRLAERDPRSHLEIVAGITHHQTARFAEPLARAVPWVRGIWSGKRLGARSQP
jgi:pimeloyl-ACP methyl ester carboxylesterase